jgi:hypothetical protein
MESLETADDARYIRRTATSTDGCRNAYGARGLLQDAALGLGGDHLLLRGGDQVKHLLVHIWEALRCARCHVPEDAIAASVRKELMIAKRFWKRYGARLLGTTLDADRVETIN